MNSAPGTIRVSDLLKLFEFMRSSDLYPLVVHAIDTAKVAGTIAKRLGIPTSYAYLSGLFHDLGLVIYAELKVADGATMKSNIIFTREGEAFNLDELIYEVDMDLVHSEISHHIVEKFGILPKSFLYAIRNHHVPFEKLEGSDEEILAANLLNIADMVSKEFRKHLKDGVVEAMRTIVEILKKTPMMEDLRSAAFDILSSPMDLSILLDNEAHVEDFCDTPVYMDMESVVEYLKASVLLIDLRSRFTLKHSSLIAALSRDLAKEILRSDYDANVLYVAGLIHDFGKIKTPVEILHKPGRLDEQEFTIMKLHVVDTYKIFSKYPSFEEFASVASTHHERLDGSGYPWGLTARQLGMRSRILQIADVFVALTEDRPYRKSLKFDEALRIIEREVKEGRLDDLVFSSLNEMIKNWYDPSKVEILPVEFLRELKERGVKA